MKDIIRSAKIYFSYKKNSRYKFYIIPAVLIFLMGIFDVEKVGTEAYMMPICFLDVALILILACFWENDMELNINKRFIKSLVVSKPIYTSVPIIINNILGFIYILCVVAIRYVVIKCTHSDMQSIVDLLFDFFITIGIISCIKILLCKLRIKRNFITVIILFILLIINFFYFDFLDTIRYAVKGNSGYTILCGFIICILFDLIAYVCSILTK